MLNLITIKKTKDKIKEETDIQITWQSVAIFAFLALIAGGWISPSLMVELLEAWRQ